MKAGKRFAFAWLFLLWAMPALAIEINDFTAARNDRFASGYVFGSSGSLTGTPLANANPSFIGLGYNWSGVGWVNGTSGNSSLALIDPRQLLIANHYKPSGIIQFASGSGQVTDAEVQYANWQNAGAPNRSRYGYHDRAGAPNRQSSDLLDTLPGLHSKYLRGRQLAHYGQTAAIGWNKIASVNTGNYYDWSGGTPSYEPDATYYMNFLYDSTTPDRTQLVPGDSGSPSFIATGSPGVMYLAGAHYLTSTGVSGWDTFLPMELPLVDSDTMPAGYLPSVVTPTTARWIGSSSGSWGSSGNWSSGAVPNDVLNSSGAGHDLRLGSVRRSGQSAALHHAQRHASRHVARAFNLTPSTTSGFTFSGRLRSRWARLG